MEIGNTNFTDLLGRLKEYAKKAGYASAKYLLTMYYVLKAPNTSRKDKIIIYSALAYLVLPIDLLSARRMRLLGWADEAAAIYLTYKKIKGNVTPEIEREVGQKLREWFPGHTTEVSL